MPIGFFYIKASIGEAPMAGEVGVVAIGDIDFLRLGPSVDILGVKTLVL